MALTGGCFCGHLRYEASGTPFDETLCHCAMCRGTTGAPAVAWFTVRPRDFKFTEGKPTKFESSEDGVRSFCPQCGTHILFQSAKRAGEVDISTSSLDDPEACPPKDQTYTASRVRWMDDLPSLTSFPRTRADGR